MTRDDYVSVTVELVRLTDNAALLAQGGDEAWIPRSLIYGPDEGRLDDREPGDEFQIRILAWKVEELGFVESHIGQGRLFR